MEINNCKFLRFTNNNYGAKFIYDDISDCEITVFDKGMVNYLKDYLYLSEATYDIELRNGKITVKARYQNRLWIFLRGE